MTAKRSRTPSPAATAAKVGDLAAASAEVIGRRLGEVARTGTFDPVETTLMVTEKAEAFARAGLAASPHLTEAGFAAARHLSDETTRALDHAARLATATPTEAVSLQAAWWLGAMGRSTAFWTALGASTAAASAAALAPVHKAAAANRTRLRK